MSQPKYYTPTVEDLVWGLTIEKLNKTRWKKIEIKSFFEWDELMSYVALFPTDLRIKNLDEDDILELGWNNGMCGSYMKGSYQLDITSLGIKIYHLTLTVYDGQCRNKAELKRLMNNIQITK